MDVFRPSRYESAEVIRNMLRALGKTRVKALPAEIRALIIPNKSTQTESELDLSDDYGKLEINLSTPNIDEFSQSEIPSNDTSYMSMHPSDTFMKPTSSLNTSFSHYKPTQSVLSVSDPSIPRITLTKASQDCINHYIHYYSNLICISMSTSLNFNRYQRWLLLLYQNVESKTVRSNNNCKLQSKSKT